MAELYEYPNNQSNLAGAIPVYGGGATQATNGDIVDPNGWPIAYTYNGDTSTATVSITSPASVVYKRTYTYSGSPSLLQSITGWVKQ